MEPSSPPITLPIDKIRDVLGNQVLEILRLQSALEAAQARIAELEAAQVPPPPPTP